MLKDEDKFQNYFTVGFGSYKSWQVQFVNKVREKKNPETVTLNGVTTYIW